MDQLTSYWWIGLLAIGVIVLLVWLTKRDQKDKKEFEQEIIESELRPEKHDDDIDKDVQP